MTRTFPRRLWAAVWLCAVLALPLHAAETASPPDPAPRLAKLKAQNEKAIRKAYSDENDPLRKNEERVLVYIMDSSDPDEVKAELLEENLERLQLLDYRGDDADGDGIDDLSDPFPAIACTPLYWRVESMELVWNPAGIEAAGGPEALSRAFRERTLRDEFLRRNRTTLFHRALWQSEPAGRASAASLHPLSVARQGKTPRLDNLGAFQLFGTGDIGWNAVSAARAMQAATVARALDDAGAKSPLELVFAVRFYNLDRRPLACRNIEIPVDLAGKELGWAVPVREDLRTRGFVIPVDADNGALVSFRLRLGAAQVSRAWNDASAPAPRVAFERCRGRIIAGNGPDATDVTRLLRDILRKTVPFEVDGGDGHRLVWRIAPEARGLRSRVTDVFADLNGVAMRSGGKPVLAGRAGWPRSLASWDNGSNGLWWHVRIGGKRIRKADWTETPVTRPVLFTRESGIPALAAASIRSLGRDADPGIDFLRGHQALRAGDAEAAEAFFAASADADFLPALVERGRLCRQSGHTADALECFRLAAAKGYPPAEFHLAELDPANAIAAFRRAADYDLPAAQVALALHLSEGDAEAATEAETLLRAAAAQADPAAQVALGQWLAATPDAQEEAVFWLAQAADQGSAEAQSAYGRALLDGNGVPRDVRRAVDWLSRAAEQGDTAALAALGRCHFDGTGVRKNKKRAVRCFRQAAGKGDPESQLRLGLCLLNGEGVRADAAEGREWIARAAENGSPAAAFLLGSIALRASALDPAQAPVAAENFRKAANQGLAVAQVWLGYCLANGIGVEKDTDAARACFEQAVAAGIPAAHAYLKSLDADAPGTPDDAEPPANTN
ncbi:MAG: tetratricopeptide repeat protein [Kiritimatiellia bacterium]